MKTDENSNVTVEENTHKIENEISQKELVGIKGWLILVGFGVLLSPVRLFFELSQVYLPLFQDGTFQQMILPSSEAYNFPFSMVLLGETIFNLFMIGASLYLIYLFFTKKASFPKLYILILAMTIIFIPLDALLVSWIFPEIEAFDSDTVREITRAVIGGAIWIPYMLVSERVKATFVE